MNSDVTTSVSGNGYEQRNEDWRRALYEAAAEVFEMMVGEPVSPHEDTAAAAGATDTTAMVGLAGSLCGILSIRCATSSAVGIASKMLGEPVQSAECVEQQLDALGEICNMVAGNFKSKITALADQCLLSVPTVIWGDDYVIQTIPPHEGFQVALSLDGEPLWFSLIIHS